MNRSSRKEKKSEQFWKNLEDNWRRLISNKMPAKLTFNEEERVINWRYFHLLIWSLHKRRRIETLYFIDFTLLKWWYWNQIERLRNQSSSNMLQTIVYSLVDLSLVGCRETFIELLPSADKLQFHETFIESTAHLRLQHPAS